MPDDAYDFKPTPDVRPFGGWVSHLADAQSNGCPRIMGQSPAAPPATPPAGKAAIVAYIKQSFEACDAAWESMNDKTAMEMVAGRGGQQRSKLSGLVGNTTHNTEMYGYISVYMRLKNVVPPSSER